MLCAPALCRHQGDFNLTNAEDGLLASGFLIGLLIACPIFSGVCTSVCVCVGGDFVI